MINGYVAGFESSFGNVTFTICDIQTGKEYKKLTYGSDVKEHLFTAKELKGLDLTKVYYMTLEDGKGNLWATQGNIMAADNAPSSLSLNYDKLTLNSNNNALYMNKAQLIVTADKKADNKVTWITSDSDVAGVSPSGVVTAVGEGTAQITAVSIYDSKVSVTCEVTVHDFYVSDEEMENTQSSYMYINDTLKLLAMCDEEAVVEGVAFKSYAPNVAEVSADGIITAKTSGQAVIEATYNDLVYYYTINVSSRIKGIVLGEPQYSYDSEADNGKSYPAIKNGDTYQIKQYSQYKLNYQASPAGVNTGGLDVKYTSENPDIVAVDTYTGLVTGVSAGKAVITLTVTEGENVFTDTITFEVLRDLRRTESENEKSAPTDIYLAVNSFKKLTLEAATLPEGWSWIDDVATELTKDSAYDFGAVYSEEGYYPIKNDITVHTYTAYETTVSDVYGRNVITKQGEKVPDKKEYPGGLLLRVNNNSNAYVKLITVTSDDPENLVITKTTQYENGVGPEVYSVEALEGCTTGKHTITVTTRLANSIVYSYDNYSYEPLAEDYVITQQFVYEVVDTRVADKILVRFDESESFSSNIALAKNKERKLVAEVFDQWGKAIETEIPELVWTSSDNKVINVTADKADSTKATVKTGEYGYAVINVSAKDNPMIYRTVKVTVSDGTPHVEGNTAELNTAVDYESDAGIEMSSVISILPAYGNQLIATPTIVTGNTDDAEESKKLRLYSVNGYEPAGYYYSRQTFRVIPQKGVDITKAEAGNYYIRMATDWGTYYAPLSIKVVTKKPSITVKQTDKVNLFYINDTGMISVSVKGKTVSSPEIEWSSQPKSDEAGFKIGHEGDYVGNNKGTYTYMYSISQNNITLDAKNKLTDASLLKGELTITIPGYKDSVTKSFAIKTSYKAPAISLYSSNKTNKDKVIICNELGVTNNTKDIIATATDINWKSSYIYKYANSGNNNTYQYAECNNKDVVISASNNSNVMTISYAGKKSTKASLVFHNDNAWRGTATAKVNISVTKPSVVLTRNSVTLNKNYTGELHSYYRKVSTSMQIKGYGSFGGSVMTTVTGSDAKAQALLDSEVLVMKVSDKTINVGLNDETALNTEVKNGNYKYNITPHYKDVNGNYVAMKPAVLTVKIVDKEAAVTAKVSGKLDLVKSNSCLTVTPKLANVDDNDEIVEAWLNGAYSDLFNIEMESGKGIITINRDEYDEDDNIIRANKTYNLSITFELSSGIIVTTKEFKVKPVQSVPKVTVSSKKIQLYASSTEYYNGQQVWFDVPAGYEIADIRMNYVPGIRYWEYENYGDVEYGYVYISDSHLAKASANGTNTKLTFIVKLVGRDGVSKDATATITANVKR